MKIIVEGTAKEIAVLVLELQGRQVLEKIDEADWDRSGVKLCTDDVLKD